VVGLRCRGILGTSREKTIELGLDPSECIAFGEERRDILD
jgi:hypothetical protein